MSRKNGRHSLYFNNMRETDSIKQELFRLIEGLSKESLVRLFECAADLEKGERLEPSKQAAGSPEAARASKAENKRKKTFEERLNKMREQARAHPERWTVDSMAEALRLTRSRFSVVYKETFGVSPDKEKREFLNQKARGLLESTSKTVQQIAKECGYNECENFIRAFRKSNGMSPLQFRKQTLIF